MPDQNQIIQDESNVNFQTPDQPKSGQKKTGIGLWIVLGLIIVIIVGISSWLLIKPGTPPAEEPLVEPEEVFEPSPKPLDLVLDSPSDGTLSVANEILVSGKTSPDTSVAIYTEFDESIISSDTQGNFTGTVLLEKGINSLVITAFATSGEEKTVSLDIVHDPEL